MDGQPGNYPPNGHSRDFTNDEQRRRQVYRRRTFGLLPRRRTRRQRPQLGSLLRVNLFAEPSKPCRIFQLRNAKPRLCTRRPWKRSQQQTNAPARYYRENQAFRNSAEHSGRFCLLDNDGRNSCRDFWNKSIRDATPRKPLQMRR